MPLSEICMFYSLAAHAITNQRKRERLFLWFRANNITYESTNYVQILLEMALCVIAAANSTFCFIY